jgi:hypothetical protein
MVLTRLVRRQARVHFASFKDAPVDLPTLARTKSERTVSSLGREGSSRTETFDLPKDVTRLSRREMRLIAGKAEHGVQGEKAKQILTLLKAERDLVTVSPPRLSLFLRHLVPALVDVRSGRL